MVEFVKLPSLEQNSINEKYISMIDQVLYKIKIYYSHHEDLTRRLQCSLLYFQFSSYTQTLSADLSPRRITTFQQLPIITSSYLRPDIFSLVQLPNHPTFLPLSIDSPT